MREIEASRERDTVVYVRLDELQFHILQFPLGSSRLEGDGGYTME